MPASRKKVTKVASKSQVKAKKVVHTMPKRTAPRRSVEKSLFQEHPNLKLLLSILGLIVVAYIVTYMMMYAQM